MHNSKTEADTLALALCNLLLEVGKFALGEGKEWREAHPELMDVYEASGDTLDNYRTMRLGGKGEGS